MNVQLVFIQYLNAHQFFKENWLSQAHHLTDMIFRNWLRRSSRTQDAIISSIARNRKGVCFTMRHQVLQLSRKMMAFVGILLDPGASGFEYYYSVAVNWTTYFIFTYTVYFSYQFIISHLDQTESILYAGMQVSANCPLACSYWSLSRAKHKIHAFLHELESFVNERMVSHRRKFFWLNFVYFTFQASHSTGSFDQFTRKPNKRQNCTVNGHSFYFSSTMIRCWSLRRYSQYSFGWFPAAQIQPRGMRCTCSSKSITRYAMAWVATHLLCAVLP